MITVENLSFSYKKGRPLFKNMSMTLKEGHIYGLFGKNGVGKSTLLKNMIGLVLPDSGTLMTLGHIPSKRTPSFLEQVFFIPEEDLELPAFTPRQYIKLNGGFYPNFDSEYMNSLMSDFEISADQKLANMSLGQKKKFGIAFGLACRTPLIVMDEPTNGLDIPSKAQFRRVMAQTMTDDRCVIISTHQVRDLNNLIDAILILDDHKIVLNSTMHSITEKLIFKREKDLSQAPIYAEESLDGYHTIHVNTQEQDSHLDLELLFNAVITEKSAITSLFNK